jgi:hypothetical protein
VGDKLLTILAKWDGVRASVTAMDRDGNNLSGDCEEFVDQQSPFSLRLDLIGPEKLPHSYRVDCD